MRKFGPWLAILVILLAAGGMILGARLTVVRGSWQRKTADAKAKVLDLRKKADEAEKLVANTRGELQRTVHGWERYWITQVQGVPGRQAGTLGVQLGTTQGLVPNSLVYVFQPSADGAGTSYVGPFKVNAAENQAALTPNWRLRPDEEKSWRIGPNWRIRTNIPRQHKSQFTEFENLMLEKDEQLAQQQGHLKAQQEGKAKAEEHLSLHMKELNGDPNRGQPNLEKFLIEGYHKAVADLESSRNLVQASVDELRRQVKRTRDEIERLSKENERLAERLGEVPQTAEKAQ